MMDLVSSIQEKIDQVLFYDVFSDNTLQQIVCVLIGETGSGKSSLIESLAKNSGRQFTTIAASISWDDFFGTYSIDANRNPYYKYVVR